MQPTLWFPQALPRQSDGTYVAKQGAPAVGWTGFLIELYYAIQVNNRTLNWRISTEVNIVPDVFPFAACPASECNNPPRIL